MKTTLLLAAGILTTIGADAETLQSAKVTTKVNDVRLYQPQKSGRQAKVGDRVSGHTSVQTGRRSRAELTFQDQTVTRLGANSTFSFRRGSRDINLNQGSILLQVPKSAGGATIRTATVTAAITGTTLMMEYNRSKWVKLITLEGTVALKLGDKGSKAGIFGGPRKVKVPAGKMIIMRPDGEIITKPVDVDLKRLLATSILAGNKTFGPLSAEARRHIAEAIGRQEKLKRKGILVSENQIERQPGSEVVIHRNTQRDIHQHDEPFSDYDQDTSGGLEGGTGPITGGSGTTEQAGSTVSQP
ncbi:MAG: FecR family protein [Verrucomicrobiae bacterium]|nr:FecR family protein [Verrucomicrobiae bacterium]NNJ85545.1 FecR domain-containing protein [Akkermansiaceae bacterium]